MRRSRAVLALALATAVSACQTVQSTNKAAVDYNRAFAKARDEITLLNVLRASERHPLQFSAISSVQGSVRSGASIRVPFINLIGGGTEAISPEVSVSSRNPTVSITPLATREFIQGISRPLSPGVIDDLLIQGWPLEVVLGLTVGGIVCSDGSGKLNFGSDPEEDQRFQRAFRNVSGFGFDLGESKPFATLRMSGKDALAAIRDGAGERRVVAVTPLAGNAAASGDVLVQLITPGQPRIKGIDSREVCGAGGGDREDGSDKALLDATEVRQGGVLMRSIFGIFQYLGRVQRTELARQLRACREGSGNPRQGPALFRIAVDCAGNGRPGGAVTSTQFNGRRFLIPEEGRLPPGDRTLESLSLLTYLVDLQTSETAVKASIPFVAITQP